MGDESLAAHQGPETSLSMSDGALRETFPRRLSQVSRGSVGHDMMVPGEQPPRPFEMESFTKANFAELLDNQQDMKDVLVQLCYKMDHLQRTLEMKPEKARSSLGSRFGQSISSAHLSSSASNDIVKKHKSTKSQGGDIAGGEARSAAASVSSMSVDMFSLNLRHNQQLLAKKKSFSVSNLGPASDQPRKGALKRLNSSAEPAARRLSQASVKVVAPGSEDPSLSLPGFFKPDEPDDEPERDSPEAEKSVETIRQVVSQGPSSPDDAFSRSPYASLAAEENPMTPVVCNEILQDPENIFTSKGSKGPTTPPMGAAIEPSGRRNSNSLSVPGGTTSPVRSTHATTMPGGLLIMKNGSNTEDMFQQNSARSGMPKSPRPSSSSHGDVRKTLTSLDSLRAQHNVKVLAQQSERLKEPISEGTFDGDEAPLQVLESLDERAMICPVRFFLGLTGVLDFKPGCFWKCLAHLILSKNVALGVLMMMFGEESDYRYLNLTTIVYALGLVVSVLLLRWGRAEEDSLAVLLGPKEFQLDEYACKRGFIASCRLLGTLRWVVLMGLWALMVTSRILAGYFGRPETGLLPGNTVQDFVAICSYSGSMLGIVAIFYVQLHVSSGLELAVDMFSAHFFDTKDICSAMDEWNILQALIRCASSRIETSFMVLGASSLASLVLLATEVWTKPELLRDPLQAVLWLGWVYPPVLLLLYSLTRAAAVSEKCSRVAPFINSWDFPDEEEECLESLHEGRQYIVQYIMQSEAGFYVKGVRLCNFTIMKLCYGFGALSFALLSHTMTAALSNAR